MVSRPRFYWLSRPLAMVDLLVLHYYISHLTIIIFISTLLTATAVATAVVGWADTHTTANTGSASATAATASNRRRLAVAAAAATALIRRAWAVIREPLFLIGSPYKCGLVELSISLCFALRQGCIDAERWRALAPGTMGVAARARPWSVAAFAVLNATCHRVSVSSSEPVQMGESGEVNWSGQLKPKSWTATNPMTIRALGEAWKDRADNREAFVTEPPKK